MNVFSYTYPVIIFAAAAISIFLAIYAFRQREKTGAVIFAWMMLSVAEWLITSGFVTLSRSPESAMVWVKARYTGLMIMMPLFLIYAIQHTGFEKWLTPLRTGFLFVIPVISILVTWTNEAHSLMIQSIRFYPDGPLLGLDAVTYGAWFWVHTIYSYLLVLVGTALLVRMAVRSLRLYRRQSIALIFGIIPPLVASVIDAFLLIPQWKHPVAPIGFAVMGTAFAISMFQFRLIDVVPVARDKLIESMSDGMLVLDDQGVIVDINPAAQDILNIPAAQAVGQPAAQVIAPWSKLIDQGRGEQISRAVIDLENDGEVRFYDLRISPLTDRRGRLSGQLVVWRDVTEDRQAEAEREQLIQELDAFAHTVAHDLKNPLSLIMGYSDVLEQTIEQQNKIGMEQHECIQYVKFSADKMINIIDALLTLAYVRQVDEIAISRLDMGQIVGEAWQRLDRLIEAHQPEITLPDEWPSSSGYAPWVEEIWLNYLSNAIKYGGQPAYIMLGSDPVKNGMVRFWVRDQGRGLTLDEQAKLFTPFTRFGQARIEGHGLGLSIVRRIAEKLGGEVGVESSPGAGSTFWFTLPRSPENSHPAES